MLVNRIEEAVHRNLLGMSKERAYARYVGEHSEELASQLCNQLSFDHCLLASSGSAAMEIALRAAKVGPGDEVLLSGYDYPGNFWAIERCGAFPVLIDVEPESWCLNPKVVQQVLQQANRCKAVLVSHLHGQLQPISELKQIVASHQLTLIEDCCQATGARLDEIPVGTQSDFAVLSFGGGKILSSGRGGALLTNSETQMQRAKLAAGAGSGPYQLSELQASVVLAQLPFLEEINTSCRSYFCKLADCLEGFRDPETETSLLRFPVDFRGREAFTAIYQFGFLLAAELAQHSGRVSATSDPRKGFTLGPGFSGFHRRSRRRCRAGSELLHLTGLPERTLVVHHGVALEEKLSPDRLAELIREQVLQLGRL